MADYADILYRIIALIVDSLILGVVTMLISIPLIMPLFTLGTYGGLATDFYASTPWILNTIYIGILGFVINMLYFVYLEGAHGQTLGKRLMGIKVVKEGGGKISFADSIVRNLLRIIDSLPFAYILGLILVLATDKKQRLGDMAAKTIVVKA